MGRREPDFPGYVSGLDRTETGNAPMVGLTRRCGRGLAPHRDDRVYGEDRD